MLTLDEWISCAWNDLRTDACTLVIRNEADLKCHLFSRLLATKAKIAPDVEIHSEVNFPMDERNSRIRVDLVIAVDGDVEAAIELKYWPYPKFEKDLSNLCRLRDTALIRDCISSSGWQSTAYSQEPLKLSKSTPLYYGCGCLDDAEGATAKDMRKKMMDKEGLDCTVIKILPTIDFSRVE